MLKIKTVDEMTLAKAKSNFVNAKGPNAKTSADYLKVATEYWERGRITANSYRDIVLRVARDLEEQ